MKVFVIMPSATGHGGAEEAFSQLIHHHGEAGFDSLRVVFLEDGPMVSAVALRGIPTDVVLAGRLREPGKFFRCVERLTSLVRSERPDVVLGWMTKAHLYGGLAGMLTRIPAIYFQMGNPDGGIVDRLARWVPAAGALACSRFSAAAQSRHVGHRVIGVPLGADFERFEAARSLSSSELKTRFGFDASRPLVGIVGRLQRWKGMHVYLEAMSQVMVEHPFVQGVIVGGRFAAEPGYEPELRKQIAKLGLQDQVRMVGAQTNVPEWMQAMDVVVHASEREPFGIVIVEAMCLGKPVIAARPGGPEEIIERDVSGQLVDWGDAAALSHAIARFLEDETFAASCAANARAASEKFTAREFSRRCGCAIQELIPTPALTRGH